MMQMMKLPVKGILTKVLLVAAMMMPAIIGASTSEKSTGDEVRYFDITIAYDGFETPQVKNTINNVLRQFAYGIYQCSQGCHKLRNVYVYSNVEVRDGKIVDNYSGKKSYCDINWRSSDGRAEAPVNGDPKLSKEDDKNFTAREYGNGKKLYINRGRSITMYSKLKDLYDVDDDSPSWYDIRMAGSVLTHEWGHYHYGVYDEYRVYRNGEWVDPPCCNKTPPDSPYVYGTKSYYVSNKSPSSIIETQVCNHLTYEYRRSLMCWQYGYACDWENTPNNLWNISRKATQEQPTRESALFLCFSNDKKVYLFEENFLRTGIGPEGWRFEMENEQFTETKNNKGQGLTSYQYVFESPNYKYMNDFAVLRNNFMDGSGFEVKEFPRSVDKLRIKWNPTPKLINIIDVSTSMGYDNRLENAKNAACAALDILPNDSSVSVYSFNDSTVKITDEEEMDDVARERTKSAIKSMNAGGGTAIGVATWSVLEDVKSALSDSNMSGVIVFLLSDGKSGDNTLAYVQEFRKLGVPIYTFGYGSETSSDLSKLASQTGGKYYYAPSGASIQRAFQEASQIFGSRNQGSSGSIGGGSGSGSGGSSVSETESFSKSFYIDTTMSNLRLTVSYPSDTPSVMVVDPNDMQIVAANETTIGNETTAIYEVPTPVPGEWRICGTKHVGAVIDYFYDSAAVVDGYRLSAASEKVSSAMDERRTYCVTAYLRKEASINAANVSGVLCHDGAEVDNVVFSNPANGTYTAFVTLEDEPKTYSLSVTADNASGKAYETFKDIIYEGREPPDDKPLGENFQRTASVTFSDEEVVAGEVMYVSAANGNDSRDGTSWATAKRTIQAAIDAVATNGTVIVTNGTYAPIVTHDKRLTIKSVEGWHKTIIDGGGTARCADLGESAYQTDSHLIGFKLVNGDAGTESGGGVRGGKLIRCRIERCHAATGGGALYSILENCVVAFNTAETTGGGAQDCSLRGCTVAQNLSAANESGQGAGINDCGAINTIIWGNNNGVGSIDNCVEAYIKYSCTTPAQDGDGNIIDDPLFMDAANGDFSLKTASPCRDAGHSGFVDDLVDAVGQPRIMGNVVDIGAYEAKALPAAPVNVAASDGLSMQYVSVSWDVSADAKAYSVWRNDGTENVCLADGLAATYFLDWTATPGIHCQYSVRAVNDIGEGDASEADEGWISVMLPGSVTASDGASTESVIVTWKGNSDAATYQIWRSDDDNIENAAQIGISDGVSYSDAKVVPGKTYYYWVRPVVDSQEGEFIGPDSGFAELPAPQGVIASSDRTDSIVVKWLPHGDDKYYVYRSTRWRPEDADFIGECTFSLPPSGTGMGLYYATFIDKTARTGVQYYYWIKAVGEDRTSRFSEYAEGVRIPEPVTGVVASDGDFRNGVAVTWSAVEGAGQYIVYRADADAPFSSAAYVDSTERCVYYDTGVISGGTIYRYWVVATVRGTVGKPGDSDTGWSRGSISGNAPYLVVDLSQGPSAERFPCYEMWSSPGLCGWSREYKTDKLVFRRISPGTFTMGSKSSEKGRRSEADDYWRNDELAHEVTIPNAYYIGIFELTIGQDKRIWNYREIEYSGWDEAYPAFYMNYWNARGDFKYDVDWPHSSWVATNSLMGVLRTKTGINTIDLPTEAEWEYACRAGTTTSLNNDSNLASASANSDDNLDALARYKANGVDVGVAQVGSFEANSWGLYDMHGNVAEWCLDWYKQVSVGAKTLRGGGHADEPRDCRSASRHGFQKKDRSDNNGVRVAIRGVVADAGADDPVFLVRDGVLVVCEPNGKTDITIPNTVKSIGKGAFGDCNGLKNVTIPNTVTNIGSAAFKDCGGLKKVSIPDSVVSIGYSAFFGCTGLVEVTIGTGLQTCGGPYGAPIDAFDYCLSLMKFVVANGNNTYKSINGMLLTKDGKTLLVCPSGKTGVVSVPDGVVRIENSSFGSCYDLSSVKLPNSIESIGVSAFPDSLCDEDAIPGVLLVDGWAVGLGYPEPSGMLDLAGIRGIGDQCFEGCSELTSVIIPEGVKNIGEYAFAYCGSLSSVSIPDSVESIAQSAFEGCNDSLYDVNSVPGVVLVDGWAIGIDDAESTSGSFDLRGTRGIAAHAFSWPGEVWTFDDIDEVLLPERLKRIDDYAFACAPLKNIVIPPNVVYIGDYGLECSRLATVTFLGNAPILGEMAFSPFYAASRVVYVSQDSTGWGVSIPGVWNGMKIAYIGETPDMIRCAVTFDANGGKPAKQSLKQIATTAWNVSGLQTPTMNGCAFDGWWTARTGGERVDLDGVCNLSVDTTLYARWLKAYKLTVKGGVACTDMAGPAESINVVNGTTVRADAADMSAKNMAFSHWTYTPATADLGDGFDPNSPQVECVMPEAALTLTANYVSSPGYACVHVQEVNGTANADGEPEGIEWSSDGKFWRAIDGAMVFPVRSGKSVSLQFRATDPRWTVPAKASYLVTEGARIDVLVSATRVAVVKADAVGGQPATANTVTMNPQSGQVLDGKPVALTAKPGKDTVFAYWLVNGEPVCYDASFKYAPDVDSTVTAVFRLTSEVQNPVLDAETAAIPENAMVGVAFKAVVAIAPAAYPAKFTASKLPSGLKIDGASGQIVGVPSKAGEYSVEITAAGGADGKAKSSITIPISIAELPAWAVGNFEGFVNEGSTSNIDFDTEVGPATMSVTAAGKVSGKCTLMGTNWTFTADSYAFRSEISAVRTNLVVEAVATAGKVSRTLSLDLQEFSCGVASAVSSVDGGFYEAGNGNPVAKCTMMRVPWSDKGDAKASGVIASYAGAYTYEVNCGATACLAAFTLDEKGVIKGTIEVPEGAKTRKVAFSSNALPHLDGLMTILAVSSDPKNGYPAIFDSNIIVNHYDEPADGFACRNPGVVPMAAELNLGSGASGTVSVNPKYGQVAVGKDVTLTAKADRDSVFGYWEIEGIDTSGLDLKAATLKFKSPGTNDVFATAKFITVDEDKESIKLAVNGAYLSSVLDGNPVSTNIWAGVYLEWPVAASALSEAKVKVAGLPAGLKFTDKPVTSKVGTGRNAVTVTNVLANTIYGAPTTASKIDAKTKAVKPSEVKVTVTTAGKSSQVYQIDTVVDALPAWAQGTFAGGWAPEAAATSGGQVSLTVSAAGKVSGKALGDGYTYTLAAPYYSGFSAVDDGVCVSSNFLADVTASWSYKDGTKTIKTNDVVRLLVEDNGIGGLAGVEDWFEAYTVNWKVEPWKSTAKSFDKQTLAYAILAGGSFSEEDEDLAAALGADVVGRVTLKFSANGTASVSGEFVTGYDDKKQKYTVVKATGSATLVPVDDGDFSLFIYLTPKGLLPHARCLDIP